MTFSGHVHDGRIVFDVPIPLPDGTTVRGELTVAERPEPTPAPSPGGGTRTLYDLFKPYIGCLDGLPADAALNHDHYLYGAPKKSVPDKAS